MVIYSKLISVAVSEGASEIHINRYAQDCGDITTQVVVDVDTDTLGSRSTRWLWLPIPPS